MFSTEPCNPRVEGENRALGPCRPGFMLLLIDAANQGRIRLMEVNLPNRFRRIIRDHALVCSHLLQWMMADSCEVRSLLILIQERILFTMHDLVFWSIRPMQLLINGGVRFSKWVNF
ncbi:hypothetical protein BDE02_01G239800 [Populus trichocarpa]|nr:hypothetical protein BDE02_01G239800 [Populus trichocarpa]